MFCKTLVLLFAASVMAHEGHDHDHGHTMTDDMKIPVTVYYESLCPDSIKFFKEQLTPSYNSFKDHISVDLVPYGKSTTEFVNNTYSFNCHHGPAECFGNIVQACVLKVFHTEKDKFEVISCLMSTVNPKEKNNETYPVSKCVNQYGLSLNKVSTCYEGAEGHMYLAELGNKTNKLSPPLTSVPSVVYGDKPFSYDSSKMAVADLKMTLCKELKAKKMNLKECNSGTTFASSMVLIAIASFFRKILS